MTPSPETNTIQCRVCGEVNDIGNAICANCHTPMTAYAGQVKGLDPEKKAIVQAKVVKLQTHPPAAIAQTIFNVVFALFWPVAYVIGNFAARTTVNSEGTNYLAAAFGSIGPILSALGLLPVALALIGVAWGTWTQQTWAWTANLVTLGLFAFLAVLKIGSAPMLAIVWLLVAGGLTVAWFRQETKVWFGA